MKLQNKGDEIWTLGVNFGIVRLGPAAGKVRACSFIPPVFLAKTVDFARKCLV